MSRLYLVDGLYHVFRSFYALPKTMQAPDGRPINVVHGILGFLRRLIHNEQARLALVALEQLTGIFREALYPEYKGNRAETDPRLLEQVPLVIEMCRCLGVATREVDGFEADDVMATVARIALAEGVGVTIVSSDKDLAQVLTLGDDIEMLTPGPAGSQDRASAGDVRVRPADVQGRYGVPPALIPSLLALRGDAADNMRGLAGVGQKTAVALLLEFGSLEDVLEAPIPKAMLRTALQNERDRLLRDLEVVTVRYDVPLGEVRPVAETFALRPIRGAAAFFESLGMKRAADEFAPLEARLWHP